MKITYQIALDKIWMLMVRLSVPILDQSVPPTTHLLLTLIGIIDAGYRLLLGWQYRRICSRFMLKSHGRED